MSKAPYMPLFYGAYLADTLHLTAEESGAYLHILMSMWARGGTIPNSDSDMARISKVAPSRWARVKARIMPLLTVREDGQITQKRLAKEWARVASIRDVNKQNANSGWAKPERRNRGSGKVVRLNEINNLGDAPASTYIHTYKKNKKEDTDTDSQDKFTEFWNLYPRKIGRDAALRAWRSAVKRAPIEAIMRGVEQYAKERHGQDKSYTAHPSTWLNGGRWGDEESPLPKKKIGNGEMFGGIVLAVDNG